MEIPVRVRAHHAELAEAGLFGVCGNSGDTIRFDFDAEWDAYPDKTARIIIGSGAARSETEIPFQGDSCVLPAIRQTAVLAVGVEAGDIRTTTAARIPYAACITDIPAEEAQEQPDLYNMLLAELMHQPAQGICNGRYLVSRDGDFLATDAGDYLMTKE